MEYAYDVFDRRVSKTVDDDGAGAGVPYRDLYVYDGQHIALEFHDADADGGAQPQLAHRYLHGPAVDMILADEEVGGEVLWPLADHLGSVRDLVNSSGVVQNHLVYSSFGKVISESNAAIDHIFGFTGRERDEETHLTYYRARYYDAETGRFVSIDPIGFNAGDANLYRYVDNEPTGATDPSGLQRGTPVRLPNTPRRGSGPRGERPRGGRPLNTPPTVDPRTGELRGLGHSLGQIAEGMRIRRQNTLAEANNEILNRRSAEFNRWAREQLRLSIENAMRSGMRANQIRSILFGNHPAYQLSGAQCYQHASALNYSSGLARMVDALARDLGGYLPEGSRVTISVTAVIRNGQIRYIAHSNGISGNITNYFRRQVRDRIDQLREQGFPIEQSALRPRREVVARGMNPHAEDVARFELGNNAIAIGTNRPHCGMCMAKMGSQVIQASPGVDVGRTRMRAEFYSSGFIGPLPANGVRLPSVDSILQDVR